MSKLMMISRVRGSDPRIMIKNLVIIWLFWDQNIPGWILSENHGTKENRKSLELVPEDCESVRKSSWTWNQLLQEFWTKKPDDRWNFGKKGGRTAVSLHVSSIEQNTAQILKEADDSRITQAVQ